MIRRMSFRKRDRVFGMLLVVAVLTAALAISAWAASPLKITNCNRAASSPKLLTLTCGDANTALTSMAWSSFGGSVAQGKGAFVMNTCEPDCAAGKDVSYAVKVRATGALDCRHGLRVYGKLALQFIGRAPGPGIPRNWKMACPY